MVDPRTTRGAFVGHVLRRGRHRGPALVQGARDPGPTGADLQHRLAVGRHPAAVVEAGSLMLEHARDGRRIGVVGVGELHRLLVERAQVLGRRDRIEPHAAAGRTLHQALGNL